MRVGYVDLTVSRFFYICSRLSITILFSLITLLQVLAFPGQFRHEQQTGHGTVLAQWALTITIGLWLATAQWALICIWHVIKHMYKFTYSDNRRMYWLNGTFYAVSAATAIGLILTIISGFFAHEPGPKIIVLTLTSFIFTLLACTYFVRKVLTSS